MKVAFAFVAAWLLRFVYLFNYADRLEAWAGIDYDPESEVKWGGSD